MDHDTGIVLENEAIAEVLPMLQPYCNYLCPVSPQTYQSLVLHVSHSHPTHPYTNSQTN